MIVVLAIIVVTWRPWDDGSASRITTSGLVPVLTLLVGQAGSWVAGTGATKQALDLRQLDLRHEAEREDARVAREAAVAAQARREQERADVRELFLEAIRATSDLAPLVSVIMAPEDIPRDECARVRVALLAALPYLSPDVEVDLLGYLARGAATSVLETIHRLYLDDTAEKYADHRSRLLLDIVAFEEAIVKLPQLR